MRYYIAGPMSGIPEFNFPAFDECAVRLRMADCQVISPAEMDRADGFDEQGCDGNEVLTDEQRQQFARNDVGALLQVDGIILLPGWESSTGATNEAKVASWLGLTAYTYHRDQPLTQDTYAPIDLSEKWCATSGAIQSDFYANSPEKQWLLDDAASSYHELDDTTQFVDRRAHALFWDSLNVPRPTQRNDQIQKDVDYKTKSWDRPLADPEYDHYDYAYDAWPGDYRNDSVIVGPCGESDHCDRPDHAAARERERRVVNATTGGEKGSKLARYDLIPTEPLRQLAEHYGRGTEKYAARNWERGYDWSLSFAALQRHAWAFWSGEDVDADTGGTHLAAVAWHAFALMYFAEVHHALDDRGSS